MYTKLLSASLAAAMFPGTCNLTLDGGLGSLPLDVASMLASTNFSSKGQTRFVIADPPPEDLPLPPEPTGVEDPS